MTLNTFRLPASTPSTRVSITIAPLPQLMTQPGPKIQVPSHTTSQTNQLQKGHHTLSDALEHRGDTGNVQHCRRRFCPKYVSLLARIAYAQQKRQNGEDCEMAFCSWFWVKQQRNVNVITTAVEQQAMALNSDMDNLITRWPKQYQLIQVNPCTTDARRAQPKKVGRTASHAQTPNAGESTWFKVIGAMPTAWFEVRRPFGIIDRIRATNPPENHSKHSNQDCFCQLRIASGYIPARLAHDNIAVLNQANRVVLERSVRASGGAKPRYARKEEKPQHEDQLDEAIMTRQHTSCATILIEEGHSIRLATPLFEILPQITEATGCSAFLTSWKPNTIAESTSAPIIQIEAD